MSLERFETLDTVQFTWTSSVAPDAAPTFKVARADPASGMIVIASITAIQSSVTQFYALFTMPGSEGDYRGEWFAQKTVSGSVYNLVKRFGFVVRESMQ